MERREFLKRFGTTSAAILFGFSPQKADSQLIPFAFLKKSTPSSPSGEQLYTTAGSYNWINNAGVKLVNVVAIGGLTDSFFIDKTTVLGGAGAGSPGTYIGSGGGNGGNTGTYTANNSGGYWAGPGGGGAGGGGYGGVGTTQGNVGSGGSGGNNGNGMHGAAYGGGAGWLTSSGAGCGGGLGWKNSIAVTVGGSYAVNVGTGVGVTNSGTHGVGAVRIMWGSGRSFPSNAT